jgi:hypothetical protein
MIGEMLARVPRRSARFRGCLVGLAAGALCVSAASACSENRASSDVGSTATPRRQVPASQLSHRRAKALAKTKTKATTTTAKPAATATNTVGRRRLQTGPALAALAKLRVRGRGPMTGYSRGRFGPTWLDVDRNGCDTRNDVLRAQLTAIRLRAGTHGCVVESGLLLDPYTGAAIRFHRGGDDEIQVDHVVALGNAWVSGAARWSIDRRAALAEDPENLLAVDSRTNQQKGDGDAASWLPPNHRERCAYVARQVAVKAKYGLSVTAAERGAIRRVLTTCPEQRLPRASAQPTATDLRITDPGPPGAGTAVPPAAGGATYANCTAVRAAGKAPLFRGQPGYASRLDRNGDGVACQ